MASLYHPTLTYDKFKDPEASKATHYQIERSPGDGFVYEAMRDPTTGTATPFYHSDSLIIATAGKGALADGAWWWCRERQERAAAPFWAISTRVLCKRRMLTRKFFHTATGSFRHQMFCYPGPRASYAVFVGPGSPLNDAETPMTAPPGTFLSLQRGHLNGAVAALQTVVGILEKGLIPYGPLRRVIIKTDSEYVAWGSTERMVTWLRKGWIGCGESHIRDWDLWEVLLALLDVIKRIWNVEVLFWLVPPKWNRDAKSLAGEGLKLPPFRAVYHPIEPAVEAAA